MPATRYGTVTTTNPVTVTLDGEDIAVTASPINLGHAVGVGDRVACEFRDKSLVILGSPVNGARDLFLRNYAKVLTGGGVRSATTSGISWSQRFTGLGAGRGSFCPAGYFQVDLPPDGTVIPVYGHTSQTQATVTGGAVPLVNWQTLWYEPPLGVMSSASDPSRFRISSYLANFEVPPTWVPLVSKNGDLGTFVWADGRETQPWVYPALSNSWANYATGYALTRYKRENGVVYVEGLIKSGTVNATVFNLPANYRPSETLIFIGQANLGLADIRVSNVGNVWVAGYYAGGNNGDVSLSNVSFPADL